jgi:hypothetical protein
VILKGLDWVREGKELSASISVVEFPFLLEETRLRRPAKQLFETKKG